MVFISGGNSIGRVTAFQAVGCEFEPRLPLMSFSVYILKSAVDDVYYIGSTVFLKENIEYC
jgi:hypothetical protein